MKQQLIQPRLVNLMVNSAGNAKADLELAPNLVIRNVEYMSPAPGQPHRVVMAHFGLPINEEFGVPSRATEPTASLPGWLKLEVAQLFRVGITAKLARHEAKRLRREERSQNEPPAKDTSRSSEQPNDAKLDQEVGNE